MSGAHDLFGRELKATIVPLADELAAAAALVSGETSEGLPDRARARRRDSDPRRSSGTEDLLFDAERDLFR